MKSMLDELSLILINHKQARMNTLVKRYLYLLLGWIAVASLLLGIHLISGIGRLEAFAQHDLHSVVNLLAVSIIPQHMIISIWNTIFFYALVILAFALFRIKNPTIRFALYSIPLIKGVLALAGGLPRIDKSLKPIGLTVQLWHPTPGFHGSLGVIIGLAIVLLAWRLTALIRFEKLLRPAQELDRAQYSSVYKILDGLVEKTNVPYPKIIPIVCKDTPFTVGINKPVVVISPSVLKMLTEDELKALLAHEIAHIARKDHLFFWPIIILRDILFFNPMSHIIYNRLSFERESACDAVGAALTPPLLLARSLIRVAEINLSEANMPEEKLLEKVEVNVAVKTTIFRPSNFFAPLSPQTRAKYLTALGAQRFFSRNESYFSRRIIELIEPIKYQELSPFSLAIILLAAVFLLFLEVHLYVNILGAIVFLL